MARLRAGGSRLGAPTRADVATTRWMWLRASRVRERLERWLAALGRPGGWRAPGARARRHAAPGLAGAGRGIAFRLVEQFGTMRRAEAESLIEDLGQADRRALARLGVRFGRHPPLSAGSAQAGCERGTRPAAAGLPAAGRSSCRHLAGRSCGRPASAERHAALGFAEFRRVRAAGRHPGAYRCPDPRPGPRQRPRSSVPPAHWPPRPDSAATSWRFWWKRWAFDRHRGAGTAAFSRTPPRAAATRQPERRPAVAGPGGSPFAVLAGLRLAP